jgi:hypothetical protein
MAMTDAQRERAKDFLRDKMQGVCPSCGGRAFQIADLVNALPYDGAGKLVLGPTVPLLLVMCDNCLHVLSFAAVPMGLLQEQGAAPTPEG